MCSASASRDSALAPPPPTSSQACGRAAGSPIRQPTGRARPGCGTARLPPHGPCRSSPRRRSAARRPTAGPSNWTKRSRVWPTDALLRQSHGSVVGQPPRTRPGPPVRQLSRSGQLRRRAALVSTRRHAQGAVSGDTRLGRHWEIVGRGTASESCSRSRADTRTVIRPGPLTRSRLRSPAPRQRVSVSSCQGLSGAVRGRRPGLRGGCVRASRCWGRRCPRRSP